MTQPPRPGAQMFPPPGFAPQPLPQRRPPSRRIRELVGLAPFVVVSLLLLVITLVFGAFAIHTTGFGYLLRSMVTNATSTALFACAIALTLHARSLDLSIFGTAALCGLIFATTGGVPGVLVALVVALVVGVVNAALVGLLGFHSVATTLGTALIMTAIVFGMTRGHVVTLKHALPNAFVYVVLVLLVLAAVALDAVHLFAPRRAGAPAFLHRSVAHVAAAALAGVGGVVQVVVLRSSVADTGWWFLLVALAAAFLGGTSASGHGRSLVGAVLAAAFVATTSLVIAVKGWNIYTSYALVGVVLVLAVGGDRLRDLLLTPKASTPARPAHPAQ